MQVPLPFHIICRLNIGGFDAPFWFINNLRQSKDSLIFFIWIDFNPKVKMFVM